MKSTGVLALVVSSFITSVLATAAIPSPKPGFEWKAVSQLPIQNHGRVKPFNTYARETVQFITGRVRFDRFEPEELIFSWLTGFDREWETTEFIKVNYGPLKKQLGLADKSLFAPSELKNLDGLRPIMQTVMKKEQAKPKEKLSDLEKKAVELQNQLGLISAVVRGEDLTILPLPNPKDSEEAWLPVSLISEAQNQLPYSADSSKKISDLLKPMLEGYAKNTPEIFNTNSVALSQLLRELSNGHYPTAGEMQREVFYNNLRPFRWAWVLYTLAFISFVTFLVTQRDEFKSVGFVTLASAYCLHLFGFGLRILISGRPPVTNMYESVIWVTFGCVTFSLLVWFAYKNAAIPAAATVFAIVGLVLADNLPAVLDPSINPLTPVLRSNFWLTIHVLTITLSYAAFALSLCLGNVVLGNFIFRPQATAKIQQYTLYMYRAVQIGVILLAAGTILGGVWADYSWGRFWGWDPKEVWALIALLLYVAVLHGRFSGWLRGFGFTAATVMCFLGVLMAWYGVNFVLGAGLHTYGFGSGGISYVLAYVIAQMGVIVAAYVKHHGVKTEGAASPSIFPR